MSVPFASIGGTQKARLVYQVTGKTGPIFNPNGLVFLPPDSAAGAVTPLAALAHTATALAGMNLLVSAGTLAISAATLVEVRKLTAKVETLLDGQREISHKLDHVLERLERVEAGISEARLARVVRRAVEAAASEASIDFDPLAQLAKDLGKFIADAKIVRGRLTSVDLGSDVRADLARIALLLRGVRTGVASAFNRATDDPDCVWSCDPVGDYWSEPEGRLAVAAARGFEREVTASAIAALVTHGMIDELFSFNDAADHAGIQGAIEGGAIQTSLKEQLGLSADAATAFLETARTAAEKAMGEGDGNIWADGAAVARYAESMIESARTIWYQRRSAEPVVPVTLADLYEESAPEERAGILAQYRAWWLYDTDGGVLYRAWKECDALRVGYGATWPALRDASARTDQPLPAPDPVVVDLDAITRPHVSKTTGDRQKTR